MLTLGFAIVVATQRRALLANTASRRAIAALGGVYGFPRLRAVAALATACALVAALAPAWATPAYLVAIASFAVVAWRARTA